MTQVSSLKVFGVLGPKAVCTQATFSCTDLLPPCTSLLGFDFLTLWEITELYDSVCPNGPWLVKSATHSTIALTNNATEAIVGAKYKLYPTADIWYRLTTWKFPLFQLLAISPRPPISITVECFAVVHLMGDPLGALEDLLRKFEGCQARAIFWQAKLNSADILLSFEENTTPSDENITTSHESTTPPDDNATRKQRLSTREERIVRLWKAFAIIADSYDEWGSVSGRNVSYELHKVYVAHRGDVIKTKEFFRICLMTAGALAADRSTKFLPVVVAQAFFIGAIAIAMIRTKSIAEGDNPSTFINIEMHSIAFTALFFWLISAVNMTSVIGTSQTAEALPRILDRFATDLHHAGFEPKLPSKTDLLSDDRIWKGGIYSWQPESGSFQAHENAREELKRHEDATKFSEQARVFLLKAWPWVCFLLPYAIFAAAILTGMGISFAVPPVGWSCRSRGEMTIAGIWISSYLLSVLSKKYLSGKTLFVITFVKDMLAFLATMAVVMATQFGIYNSSICYTKFGSEGLALPQQGATGRILQSGLRLGGSYTVIVTFGVLVQLVTVPLLLLWRYYAAFRVLLQRDDGTSNLDYPRIRRILAFCARLIRRIFCCGGRRGGSCPHRSRLRNSQDLEEKGEEMGAVRYSDGLPQTAGFPPEMPTETDGAQEHLLSPSSAYVPNRPPFERGSLTEIYG